MSRFACALAVSLPLAAASLLASAPPAVADVAVRFVESAPRDRLVFTNATVCALPPLTLTLDLSTAPGGLLFDTVRGGPGTNVAQPVRFAGGGELATLTPVADGDRTLMLSVPAWPPQGEIVLTVDIDDSVPSGPLGVTMVSRSEAAGITARLASADHSAAAPFDNSGSVVVPFAGCLNS